LPYIWGPGLDPQYHKNNSNKKTAIKMAVKEIKWGIGLGI
jgi:hypothetical protein